MAWYSLRKWLKSFCKIPIVNYIEWYKNYLYNNWFNALSEEEQIKEVRRVSEEEKRKEREGKIALNNLMMMTGLVSTMCEDSYRAYKDISLSKSKYW